MKNKQAYMCYKHLHNKDELVQLVVPVLLILCSQTIVTAFKISERLCDNYQNTPWYACRGEISVICQDVRHLKEKFDLEVPLSKSLSSSQTSFILASSGSSLKTATCDLARFGSLITDIAARLDAEKAAPSNLGKEGSQASSVSSSSSASNNLEEERSERNHSKSLFSDDGWDVFDKDAEFAEAPYFVDAKE